MNYRHAFHAGNFADVVKHAVLSRIVAHLKEKPAAFRVIDTHAGAGLYDLAGPEASRTGEWREGIGKLVAAEIAPVARDLLAPYLEAVAAFNPVELVFGRSLDAECLSLGTAGTGRGGGGMSSHGVGEVEGRAVMESSNTRMEVLPSVEESPVAEGVAEMSRMDGMRGCALALRCEGGVWVRFLRAMMRYFDVWFCMALVSLVVVVRVENLEAEERNVAGRRRRRKKSRNVCIRTCRVNC